MSLGLQTETARAQEPMRLWFFELSINGMSIKVEVCQLPCLLKDSTLYNITSPLSFLTVPQPTPNLLHTNSG